MFFGVFVMKFQSAFSNLHILESPPLNELHLNQEYANDLHWVIFFSPLVTSTNLFLMSKWFSFSTFIISFLLSTKYKEEILRKWLDLISFQCFTFLHVYFFVCYWISVCLFVFTYFGMLLNEWRLNQDWSYGLKRTFVS